MHSGLKILKNWLEREPDVDCVMPIGGTTALIRYNKDIPSRKLCRDLQAKTGVAILPGETLEMEGYLRVGYCVEPGCLEAALEKFSEYLRGV